MKGDHSRGTSFRAMIYMATVVWEMLKKLVASDRERSSIFISEDLGATWKSFLGSNVTHNTCEEMEKPLKTVIKHYFLHEHYKTYLPQRIKVVWISIKLDIS